MALLHQIGHVIDELEATKAVARRLTPAELESRLRGPSVKECYGSMADRDRNVMLPLLRRMQEDGASAYQESETSAADWNAMDFQRILERAQAARMALLQYAKALPPDAWTRTGTLEGETCDVFGLLHALTQHDATLLQSVAKQLQRSF